MRVNIFCPKCQQKYSVESRKGLEQKGVRCKKCQHSFRAGEGLKQKNVSKTNLDPLVLAQPVDEPELALSGSSSRPIVPAPPAAPKDMSQYFLDVSQQSPTARLRAKPSTPQQPTHIKNPLVILAVVGAIASSLLLAGAAIAFRLYQFSAVAKIARNEIVEQAETPVDDVPTIQRKNSSPNRFDLGATPVPQPLPTPFPLVHGNLPEQMPAKIGPPSVAPRVQDELLHQSEARNQIAQEQIRQTEQEIMRLEEEKAQKRTRRTDDFKAELAAKRAEREAKRLKAKQLELHLKRKELEAENNPLQGLLTRIPIDGWGVTCLAINNKRLIFLGMNDGIQVYDWKRKKIITTTGRSERISRIEHICLDEAGKFLASANSDDVIEVFKVSNAGGLKAIKQFGGKSRQLTFIAFDKKGSRLVSANRAGEVCLWDVARESQITTTSLGDGRAGKLVAIDVDKENGTVRFTNGKTWNVIRMNDGELVESGDYPFSISSDGTYLPDQRGLIQARGSELYVMREDVSKPVLELKGNGVQWTITNAGGTHFLTGGTKKIYQWALSDGELTHVWAIPDASYITTIVMSPDGSKMAATSGSTSQDVYVFAFE